MPAELNPRQVKQREHIGIGAMLTGLLFILTGLVVLFISWPAAGLTIATGVIALAGGAAVLARIPNLLGTTQEGGEPL